MGLNPIEARYAAHVGQRIGRLTFLGLSQARGDGHRAIGRFDCDCGNVAEYPASRVLMRAERTHCGCMTDRGAHRTHGQRSTPEYSSWTAMKARCLNPKHKDFPRWGGAGITVCDRWAISFPAFLADVGARPRGTTLDRIDGRRGYEPGNVRWATAAQQAQNRRDVWMVEINGERFISAAAAAQAFNVSTTTISRWCFGGRDKRRTHLKGGGSVQPKPGCSMWRGT